MKLALFEAGDEKEIDVVVFFEKEVVGLGSESTCDAVEIRVEEFKVFGLTHVVGGDGFWFDLKLVFELEKLVDSLTPGHSFVDDPCILLVDYLDISVMDNIVLVELFIEEGCEGTVNPFIQIFLDELRSEFWNHKFR